MAGLDPAISIELAKPCHGYRDRRVKPGDDMLLRSRDAIRTRVIGTRSNKATNLSLSAPIFAREYRRWLPVPSRSVFQVTMYERRKSKEAERRQTRSQRPHPAGCGARGSPRARLSASHHGACCSERTPQLDPSYALPGTGLGRSGCYPLPAVLQCSGL
jgi:hypothetical protein